MDSKESNRDLVNLCQSLDVVSTKKTGNAYVANKAIYAGELLLSEEPAAFVPFSSVSRGGSSRVLSCASRLAVLLLQRMKSERWVADGLRDLCSNMSLRSHEDKGRVLLEARGVCSVLPDVSLGESALVVDKILSNVFTAVGPELNPIGVGLYLTASKFNHSCCSNAVQSFSGDRISVRASRDIDPGEEVTIAYIDVGLPTVFRRQELLSSYQFWCNCNKCTCAEPCCGFRCLKVGCGGLCHPSTDASCFKYWQLSETPRTISKSIRKLSWHHHLPFIYEFENVMLRISSDGYVSEIKRDSTGEVLTFTCSKCLQQIPLKDWIEALNILASHRARKDDSLEWARRDVALLSSTAYYHSYILLESINSLVLKLISSSKFEEACAKNFLVLPLFLELYPGKSIIVAIQHFQQAKLCAFLGDEYTATRCIQQAIDCLAIVCGEEHELYLDAVQFKYSVGH